MELYANNAQVRKYFENFQKISKQFGPEFTKRLQKRIAELQAYNCVFDLFGSQLGSPHFLKGDLDSCIAVSITGNIRLILETGISSTNRNALEIMKLKKIEIKGVVDYHGKYEWLIP